MKIKYHDATDVGPLCLPVVLVRIRASGFAAGVAPA